MRYRVLQFHMSVVSFFKVPLYVSNAEDRYYILDLLLPTQFNDEECLRMTQWLIQFRLIMQNQTDIDGALAHFFQNQSFSCFNMMWVHTPSDPEKRRISHKGMEFFHIGDDMLPLSATEWDTQYFCIKVSLTLSKIYINN